MAYKALASLHVVITQGLLYGEVWEQWSPMRRLYPETSVLALPRRFQGAVFEAENADGKKPAI